jgi:hypothetical protein
VAGSRTVPGDAFSGAGAVFGFAGLASTMRIGGSPLAAAEENDGAADATDPPSEISLRIVALAAERLVPAASPGAE